MSKYSIDKIVKIINDDTGECITVGPDEDGLDCVEISVDDISILLSKEQAVLLGEQLLVLYK